MYWIPHCEWVNRSHINHTCTESHRDWRLVRRRMVSCTSYTWMASRSWSTTPRSPTCLHRTPSEQWPPRPPTTPPARPCPRTTRRSTEAVRGVDERVTSTDSKDYRQLGLHSTYTTASNMADWLFEFCGLATSKDISGLVSTCDSADSWWFYGAASLGNQAISTMTWYPTHSHYP